MPIGSIIDSKELEQTYQPLLLCEFTFKSGRILRVSTHALSATYLGTPTSGSYEYGGFEWQPRVLNQDIAATQAMSDLGLEVVPQVTVTLADPDKSIFNNWEITEGFKGAILRLYAVMFDPGDSTTGSFSSDSPPLVKFIGTCAASSFDEKTLTVVATSLLNMVQLQYPPIRVQPFCNWTFPTNLADRLAGLNDSSSIFYECGYSYGITASALSAAGVGNAQTGTAAFTSCDLTFAACIERLGNPAGLVPIEKDKAGNFTGRFGGMDWIPAQSSIQRPYVSGTWETIVNNSNESKYGDYVGMAYGITWISPLVMGTWSDGNYTNFEVLVCFGEINGILKVVVNGVEIARIADDADNANRPGNVIPAVITTPTFKNGCWRTINRGLRNGAPSQQPGWGGKGDPYGSLAAIYVSVLAQLAGADAVPDIQILIEGAKVRTYTDVSTFTKSFSENPAWILMDLLTFSAWKYEDMDIQSFIDAAAKCDAQTYFVRQDGTFANVWLESETARFPGDTVHHRFSCGFSIRQRSSIGEILRGVRNCMKALLYFDYVSGKLKLVIKETIASQQPAPIVGSNFNTPEPSVTVEGVVQDGYVAYSFDGSNIMKVNGVSTLTVSQLVNQDAPNKITVQFQNRENVYSQDSATIIDMEDSSRLGQEITGQLTVYGPHDFDHVRRIVNTYFAETFRGNPRFDYRGSAIGDTGGTLIFDFQTTIKGVHLGVGQICLLSDAQLGIDQQPVRITRIQPSINFESVKITAAWENDNWYQDSFGQANQPIYAPAQGGANRPPFCWRPGVATPMGGDAYYNVTDQSFDVGMRYDLTADGSYLANVLVIGKLPINSFPPVLAKPKLEVLGTGITGGNFPSGAYWVGVSEKFYVSTASFLSALSFPVMVPVTASVGGLSFVAQAWPKSPSGYVAFAGLDPLAMSFQDEGSANPQTVQLLGTYNQASWGPPDEVFDHFRWRISKIRHGGVWGDVVSYTDNAISATYIKISVFRNYGFTPNEWADREASVYALAARTPGDVSTPIPIANFKITGNDAERLFVLPYPIVPADPTTCVDGGPLQSGDVIVMRGKPTYGTDSRGNYFEDPLWINELNPLLVTRLVSYATNTSPITITLDLSDGSDFPFSDGDSVVVQYVSGNDGANGGWIISGCDPVAGTFVLDHAINGGGASSGSGDYIQDGIAGLQDRGLAPDAEAGMVAFIIAGTGLGTWVRLTGNTQTRVYIDGDWPVTPDSTTRIIIIEPVPIVDLPASSVRNSTRELISIMSVQLENYDRVSLLIQVGTESIRKLKSKPTLDPFREMYMIGSPGVQDIPGVTPFSVRSEGYAMLTINNLGISSNAYAVSGMNFLVPSVDETDVGLWWTASAVNATDDPVTFTPGRPPNKSRFGTQFEDGDYVVWRDAFNYEVNLMKLNNDGSITLTRHDPSAARGVAFFGSKMVAHASGTRLYRVIPKIFPNALTQNLIGTSQSPSKVPAKWEFPWANKCVLAVISQPSSVNGNGPTFTLPLEPTLTNKTPGFGFQLPNGDPPAPGLRTLNGAAYTNVGIPGILANGVVTRFRAKVQAWESIRCVFANVRTASQTADLKIHVLYIGPEVDDPSVAPSAVKVGLIDTVIIPFGATQRNVVSYPFSNLPNGRLMPYHAGGNWPMADWPPNELPAVFGALDSNKELILPITPVDNSASNGNVYFAPDGYIAAIVETSSADAQDLNVFVQT